VVSGILSGDRLEGGKCDSRDGRQLSDKKLSIKPDTVKKTLRSTSNAMARMITNSPKSVTKHQFLDRMIIAFKFKNHKSIKENTRLNNKHLKGD
jgi:hypothetical protein